MATAAAPIAPIVLVMLFEAAYLALAVVTGMALFHMSRDVHNRRAAALVVISGALTYYATRRLPTDPMLWLGLLPIGLLFLVVGFYAGRGFHKPTRPSVEEQIAELTGEDVSWSDLRPDRKPRWRR